MSNESKFVPLKSLAHVITKGTTPTKKQGYTHEGINFIRALSIDKNGQLDEGTFLKISDETNDDLKRSIVQEGDVLYTIAGVIGRVTVVEKKHLPANLNQALAIIRPKKDKISSRYLANLLRSHDAQFYLKSRVVEAVQANLSLFELGRFPVEKISLEMQNSRNKLLELIEDRNICNSLCSNVSKSLISSLFRSWFIDFDPVKAKSEGKLPYGMDEKTAALFPDRFEDSELGPIPIGWKIRHYSDCMDLKYGGALKAEERTDGEFPVIGSNGVVGTHNEYLVNGPSIVIGRKGNPGTVNWIDENFFPIDTTFYVQTKDENIPLEFLYHSLSFASLPWFSADSAVPGINRNVIIKQKLISPPVELIEAFSDISEIITQQIRNTSGMMNSLISLNEAILPRMMSGELSVS